jgi:large subunit ribosomal protein L7Ae
MAQFVKYEMSDALYDSVKVIVEKASKSGKIKVGVNEVTKILERGKAKFVVMAEDVSPEELLLHIPSLSESKKVPFTYVKAKKELGEFAGLKVGTSCLVLLDEGQAKKEIEALVKQIKELKD